MIESLKMAYCNDCDVELIVENNWHISHKKSQAYRCKDCNRINNRKFKFANQLSKKIGRLQLKLELINAYGGKCNCCGETNWIFLTIDHIAGGGNIHRKNIKRTGTDFYRWLKINNYPKDNYQLLCYNCNITKGHQGFCPCKIDKKTDNSCSRCNTLLNIINWTEFNKFGNHKICIDCLEQLSRKGNAIYNNKKRKYYKNYRLLKRLKIIQNYSAKCQICEQKEPYFLAIDHINNNGAKERNYGLGSDFFNWIINNNYPKDNYRLLCHNCNSAKNSYGNSFKELANKSISSHIELLNYKNLNAKK